MGQNITDLLERTLDNSRLELLHLLAYQAAALEMPLYLVGGVVRDVLLGRSVKDFDLVVEGNSAALAEAVLKKYGGRIMVHSRFGTATWVVNESTYRRLGVPALQFPEEDMSFDLISARSETYSQPGALPTVKFSSIDDDLHRRDFTINAMAVRLNGQSFGELYDPLGGQIDLQKKLIRFVHPGSFIDDPTRMFRAVRYSMRYSFQLDTETERGMFDREAREVLSHLSGERIRHEFDLIFEEERPLLALAALNDEIGLTQVIHPALEHGRAMSLSYLKEPAEEFGAFTIPDILTLRQTLGWVLYLMHLPVSDIDSVADRLAFPALLTKAVHGAASLFADLPSFAGRKPSQWTFHLDELLSLSVYAVWLVTSDSALFEYLTKWQNIKPYTTGYDLKKRGIEPGPIFKEILARLRTAWLDGEISSADDESMLLEQLL